jgi:general secretion pathway protein F
MPQFRYRAVTRSGEMVVGDVEAPTREEVLRRIEYLGHIPIEAELATAGLLKKPVGGGKLPSSREVTIFLRQLTLLICAGLTLEQSLQTLAEDTSKPIIRFASGLRSTISSGDSFAEALERYPTIFEPAHVAMVRAGEASGKLDAVLRAVVDDRTRRERIGERVGAAVRYPMFLVGSAALILFFFLMYVVPQFESVFRDLGGRLNSGAAFALAASSWLRGNLYAFLGACAAVACAGWLILRSREARGRLFAVIAKIPGIAGPIQDGRTTRIISTLGLLTSNGVSLPATLKILRDIVTEPLAIAAVDRVHDQVRNGRRFTESLAETDLLPQLAVRMLRVGEETGDLPSIADHAAQFYEHRFGLGLDRIMGAIGPATIIVVSIVVGALVVSIMTALLSITELAT